MSKTLLSRLLAEEMLESVAFEPNLPEEQPIDDITADQMAKKIYEQIFLDEFDKL